MYRINWQEFLTDDFIAGIRAACKLGDDAPVAASGPLFKVIFENCAAGLVFKEEPTPVQLTEMACNVLEELSERILAKKFQSFYPSGFIIKDKKTANFESEIIFQPSVNVNSCNKTELSAIPGISVKLAEQVITERLLNGSFKTPEEFEKRVDGIGPAKLQQLKNLLVFDESSSHLQYPADALNLRLPFFGAFIELVNAVGQEKKLEKALNIMAVESLDSPHPHAGAYRFLELENIQEPAFASAGETGIMEGEKYYEILTKQIRGAKKSILICMFHISTGNENHPTTALLDLLGAAGANGINIKVLMDKDRETDPYLSTIINSPAKKILEEKGIEVRFDASDRLLHSKFVIIDEEIVIIGSHNWTGGSFSGFQDLSFCIISPVLATQQTERFEYLWENAE